MGVLDVRHQQSARGGRGDPEVDAALEHDLLGGLVPGGVELRVARSASRPPWPRSAAGETLTSAKSRRALSRLDQLHRRGDVAGHPLGDVRRGERRLHHRRRGRLADALDRDPRRSSAGDEPAARLDGRRRVGSRLAGAAAARSTSVAGDHAARARCRSSWQVDAEILGQLATGGLASTARPRRLRLGRGRAGCRQRPPLRLACAGCSGVRSSARRDTGASVAKVLRDLLVRLDRRGSPAARLRGRRLVVAPVRPVADQRRRPARRSSSSPPAGCARRCGRRGLPGPLPSSMVMIGVPTSTVSPSATSSAGHRAGERAGQLDQRLAGLDLDQDVVDLDLVADGDPPGDDLGLDQTLAGVGQPELLHRHATLLRDLPAQ